MKKTAKRNTAKAFMFVHYYDSKDKMQDCLARFDPNPAAAKRAFWELCTCLLKRLRKRTIKDLPDEVQEQLQALADKYGIE